MEKKISIILPNYNSSETILDTINSIEKQTYTNWQLILVDDGSDIKTKNILRKIKNKKIKIFFLKKNKGAAFCRNFAISKSNSDFYAFIDSDDLWHENKLKLQINFMIKKNYSFTYTHYKTFQKGSDKIKYIASPSKFDFSSFIKNTTICTSTMMLNKFLIKKFKFLNLKICEDYYFKCQILKEIDYAYCCPYFLTKYQIRKKSLQSNRFQNLYWMWKINKNLNKFNFFKNFLSLFFISLNSIKKYGLK